MDRRSMLSTPMSTHRGSSSQSKLRAVYPAVKPPSRVAKKHLSRPIDTHLSSYDRTDPFSAINVLLKLLSSLPSRIGGCQFKLTSDEHKLSLHLLSIVEPFVSTTPDPNKRTITRQPTEILDAISSHIEERRDLLSLGLSCKRLHGIVHPRHIQYRVIRCKVSSLSVWNHLIVHRGLAGNVRRLEILDEREPKESQITPAGIMTTETDIESTDDELGMHDKQERFLISALAKMDRLTVFKWSCNHSPISIHTVWPILLRSGSLKELDVSDNLVFSPVDDEENSKSSRALALRDMNAVSLKSTAHTYGSSKNPELRRISSMLNQCPNLKSLNIAYTQPRGAPSDANVPRADEFLLASRWNRLTTLSLTNLHLSLHSSILGPFLGAHTSLEILLLEFNSRGAGSADLSIPGLPTNALPRLREISAPKQLISVVLGCPCIPVRPLEVLKGFKLSGARSSQSHHARASDRVFLDNLKSPTGSVKRVEMLGWHDLEDVRMVTECVPGVTWLDVGKRIGGSRAPPTASTASHLALTRISKDRTLLTHPPVTNTLEWAELLEGLPDLAVLQGVRFFYEVAVPAGGFYSPSPSSTVSSSSASAPSLSVSTSASIATAHHLAHLASLSMADRSRMRKNDEIAGVLAWKCRKLRRVDHWEEGTGKVIVLLRDGESTGGAMKAKWDVKRVKP